MRAWLRQGLAAFSLLAGSPVGADAPAPYPADYALRSFGLPAPGGRYPVGTMTFAVPAAGGEPIPVVAWYPAAAARGALQPYLDPAEQRVQAPAVARNFAWPEDTLRAVGSIPTHSHRDAPVAAGRFPLVIFSHGLLGYARQNTALMERLAAHGYLILAPTFPGDAADLPTADGTIPTIPLASGKQPDIARLMAFWNGTDHAARVRAFGGFWDALAGTRTITSIGRWQRDIVRLVEAVRLGRVPIAARPLAAAADRRRLGLVGMSFGGSASASACQRYRRCRAAINLDGFEFDRALYDVVPRMPLMLIQSDWTAYPNMGPVGGDYTPYDYAYRRWHTAGDPSGVRRFRIAGLRHLGLTDLALAPADPVRDRLYGPADGQAATAAVNGLIAAFLDRNLRGRRIDLDAVAARYAIIAPRRSPRD